MNSKKVHNISKILVWIPVIIMGILITGFSTQNGSQSSGISRKAAIVVIDLADGITNVERSDADKEILIEKLQFPIRKAAHMTEYAIFAFMVFLALSVDGILYKRRFIGAFVVTFLLACSDEIHQRFVPGRCGTFKDVIIDCVGAIFSLIFCAIFCKIFRKRNSKKRRK